MEETYEDHRGYVNIGYGAPMSDPKDFADRAGKRIYDGIDVVKGGMRYQLGQGGIVQIIRQEAAKDDVRRVDPLDVERYGNGYAIRAATNDPSAAHLLNLIFLRVSTMRTKWDYYKEWLHGSGHAVDAINDFLADMNTLEDDVPKHAPKWTRERPTEPGWYWVRNQEFKPEPEAVRVWEHRNGKMRGWLNCPLNAGWLSRAEWSGPLEPPEE